MTRGIVDGSPPLPVHGGGVPAAGEGQRGQSRGDGPPHRDATGLFAYGAAAAICFSSFMKSLVLMPLGVCFRSTICTTTSFLAGT